MIILYLVFNTLYIILDAVTTEISWHRLLVPSFALWYILSLIYWRICLQMIPQKWLINPKAILCISFLLSLLVGFVPLGNEMSFQRAVVFWPFFILGYYLRQKEGMRWLRKKNKWIAGSILLVMLLIVYFFLPPFYANAPYRENLLADLLLRFVQLVIALTICCSSIALIPEKLGKITDIGKYTLIIYLLHPPVVKTLKVVSAKIGYQPDLLIAILITAFTVILIYNLRRLKIFKYIV